MIAPCEKCPFRRDVTPYLRRARAREIADSLVRHQQPFPCHLTVSYDEEGEARPSFDELHCAGAAIMLEAMNRPNQLMRIAERLGEYDPRKLAKDIPVFTHTSQFIAAHGR